MTTQYYKSVTELGTHYFATEEDYSSNEDFIEDMLNQGVHIDSDQAWRWHDYDFTLIKEAGYTPDEFIALLKGNKYLVDKDVVSELEDILEELREEGETVDLDDITDYLLKNASYTHAKEIYKVVNDDLNNTIKAFTVDGYSQGDSAFIWFDTATSLDYTPNDIQEVLYDTWTRITQVDNTGKYLDGTEDEFTTNQYGYGLNEYMLEHYNAVPAEESTTLKLS